MRCSIFMGREHKEVRVQLRSVKVKWRSSLKISQADKTSPVKSTYFLRPPDLGHFLFMHLETTSKTAQGWYEADPGHLPFKKIPVFLVYYKLGIYRTSVSSVLFSWEHMPEIFYFYFLFNILQFHFKLKFFHTCNKNSLFEQTHHCACLWVQF